MAMLGRNAFSHPKLGVPFASLAISVVPARTLRSPTAGIGTELLAHREKIEVTRHSSPFERSPVPIAACASPLHARSLRTSPENPSNLRLAGGEGGIRTPGTAKAYMGGIRPKCGALFGTNKSIRAGENLFARGSGLIWISSVPFLHYA